jgi:hypothetical protein
VREIIVIIIIIIEKREQNKFCESQRWAILYSSEEDLRTGIEEVENEFQVTFWERERKRSSSECVCVIEMQNK